ncbi:mycofactocin-coupled SDR family oxidoreductase [Frankia sp. AgB1.9]|uniref:mycofactocin-coupled SDR family oxidoreductase n=1 Tax=unclassified Frankia TaxID=2632575 RepID=UPI001931E6B5|nr:MULTISPECIES: mycofactocin-coupled SDR family oxidoreductase [unclassified Frankia]MBL7492533.1 mycofactocin-coupled SDR family oxidoreductase [Frankia sp. AgW1.1]MBL7546688.1 mycofactocin-coupled SDR family oxidoreductase [Frankia sp. AgB1.9]MBL7622844.1 mycofactocin-coupled SDR family oxidoreductase [Frankia sp. AgB1.8]
MGKLEGKVAFITGAGRGQGRSHAVTLAGEGADIIAVDICEDIPTVNYEMASAEDLAQTVKEVEALGRSIVAVKADVRVKEQLKAALDQGLARFGQVDIVCANAGILPLNDRTLIEGFIDGMDVDFVGAHNTVAVVAPHLRAGASIIVTGSCAGLMKNTTEAMGKTGGVGYSFAKRLIFQYVETLALQLAPHNIRLNAVHPTNVNTRLLMNDDIYRSFRPDLVAEGGTPTREDAEVAFPGMQPMPIPYIEVGDASALVVFLASDDSRYITGLNLRLDAGSMLKGERAI